MNPWDGIRPAGAPAGPLRVLLLGAHSDDIEIGCGGTVLRLLAERPDARICWVVLSAEGERANEARAGAGRFLDGADAPRVSIHAFRNGYFPWVGAEIKDAFEALKASFEPDLIFTHTRDDRHQDHRVVSDLTWNTWRAHRILEYEIPKYDADLAHPNVYVTLDPEIVDRKVAAVLETFRTQRERHWFTEDLFRGLLRLRGTETGRPGAMAEAFHGRKIVC